MLQTIDLSKEYKIGNTSLRVLKGINLAIGRGEITGIVGPSGAGKSTLLHLCGGLDEPTTGKVLLEGKDISKLNDKQLCQLKNKRFGFVFQFYHLLPEFSAIENIMLPAVISNQLGKKEIRRNSTELLKKFGLAERLNHRPSELSGGEQQRVAIARALINNPEILFCDEPTGNLDTETGQQIKSLLWKLNKEYKMTMVIVTHDHELVKDATKTIHLRDGKLLN